MEVITALYWAKEEKVYCLAVSISLSVFCFLVGSQYLVNGFLRASALVVVYNLPAVGCDARGDDVQVGVVGVIVGIDKQRLSGFRIAHFPEILVGELQQLGFRLLVSLAGYGHMELRLLYPAVPGGIFPEILDQFIGGGSTKCSECPEILDFE